MSPLKRYREGRSKLELNQKLHCHFYPFGSRSSRIVDSHSQARESVRKPKLMKMPCFDKIFVAPGDDG
jgi:hypothetical protein